ncbi:dihydrodipicolinate synthetase family protein [Colletotrichum tabaci]|uniref:Dihydrodipicolinate synthetase family protein n=1 Tax=Colletotrichum tabaci TaxID=1209068 RepID=A0AAV9TT80_9PEZI
MDWSSQEKLLGPLAKCFMEDIASLENLVYNADAPCEIMASIYAYEYQAPHFYNDQGRKRHGIETPATLLDTNEGIKIRKLQNSSTESGEENGIFVCHGRDICACLRPRYEALDGEEAETDCAPHPPLQLFIFMLRKHDGLQFVRGAFDRTY